MIFPTSPGSATPPRRFLLIGIGASFCLLLTFLYLQSPTAGQSVLSKLRHPHPFTWTKAQDSRLSHLQEIAKWDKPAGLKVIGLVFYGRKRYVEILECYLRRNLVENGGILDEIVFTAKTENEEDLNYLDELLASNPKYRAEYHHEKGINFSQMYGACVPGVICVKIDDDVLYIEDSAIRSIVKKKVEHPEYIGVSANLVVNFATAWIHYHQGAVYPFLPELEAPIQNTTDWRPSKLPEWKGPDNFEWKGHEQEFSGKKGHRWLPLPATSPLKQKTPIDKAEPLLNGNGWHNWMLATQQHYSFFRNLEHNELWRYNFETWNTMYQRVSINMFAFSGDDLKAMGHMPGADEQMWTMDYPRKTGRPFVIDGHGLATHNGYASMSKQSDKEWRIEGTNILDMYKLYADEMICSK